MFWMIGGIYASAMAWAIIPHYGEWTVSISSHGTATPMAGAIPPHFHMKNKDL